MDLRPVVGVAVAAIAFTVGVAVSAFVFVGQVIWHGGRLPDATDRTLALTKLDVGPLLVAELVGVFLAAYLVFGLVWIIVTRLRIGLLAIASGIMAMVLFFLVNADSFTQSVYANRDFDYAKWGLSPLGDWVGVRVGTHGGHAPLRIQFGSAAHMRTRCCHP